MPLPQLTVVGTVSFMELQYGQDGKPRCSFTIGASEKDRNGEWQNFNIKTTVFGKTAEFVNSYFNDGSPIIASGKLVEESWVDANGQKKKAMKMQFPDISFVPKEKDAQQQPNSQPQQNGQAYQQPQQQGQPQGYTPPNNQYQQPQGRPPADKVPAIDIDDDLEIPF